MAISNLGLGSLPSRVGRRSLRLPYLGSCLVEGRAPNLDSTEKMVVGCSARNRAFSKKLLERLARFAMNEVQEAMFFVIDVPFAKNDAAIRSPNAIASVSDYEKNIRIGDERTRAIARVIAAVGAPNIKIVRWPEISRLPIYNKIQKELENAVHDKSVRNSIMAAVRVWLSGRFDMNEGDESRFFGFLLAEIPAFIVIYYELGFNLDVYPGENIDFFLKLESGVWDSRLPIATSLAKGKKLSFVTCPISEEEV
jgi:tRNA-dependent cyclodipeptide synthase